MTAEELIEEGRKLQRPCFFLRPEENGPVAAVWYDRWAEEDESGEEEDEEEGDDYDEEEDEEDPWQCWLTVDASRIPGLSLEITGYLSIFTNNEEGGGKVEVTSSWPDRKGIKLYAHAAEVLPPLEAVFVYGSEAVGEWLASNKWKRMVRYNDNFADAGVVEDYIRVWEKEFPVFFKSDIHAILGGWHFPMADNDWHDLLDEKLMVFTIRDSEPWVEGWQFRTGEFEVIERVT